MSLKTISYTLLNTQVKLLSVTHHAHITLKPTSMKNKVDSTTLIQGEKRCFPGNYNPCIVCVL